MLPAKSFSAPSIALTHPAYTIHHTLVLATTVVRAGSWVRDLVKLPGSGLGPRPIGYALKRDCLALAIYHEARGEAAAGQFAVAHVVVNRTRSLLYPSSVCGVVFQNARRRVCQFSFACDRLSDYPREQDAWAKARVIAAALLCRVECSRRADPAVLAGLPVKEMTHYHATRVRPAWARRIRLVGRIGQHVFYSCEDTLSRRRKGLASGEPASFAAIQTASH